MMQVGGEGTLLPLYPIQGLKMQQNPSYRWLGQCAMKGVAFGSLTSLLFVVIHVIL